jgi:hypothetical protein
MKIAPEVQNIGNIQKLHPFLAPEGRNISAFKISILRPSGAKNTEGPYLLPISRPSGAFLPVVRSTHWHFLE